LLLAIGAAILATDTPQAATNRPFVGVILWDGYTGSPHVTQQKEMGFLKPEKWRSRAPRMAREPTNSNAIPLPDNCARRSHQSKATL
jgi:hypothetical protein